MSMRYVSKIQANLKSFQVIKTNKMSNCVLDGSYNSIYKGNSMNFDELREYVTGDDMRDIDWKASARSRRLLVRQFIAEKKHNVMFVFDTNRRMLADSKLLEEKRELAIMGAGAVALFVNKNSDYVGSIYSTKDSMCHFPFKTGLENIEQMLQSYKRAVTEDNHTDLNRSLEYIIQHFNRRMIIFIVSDLEGLHSISDTNLRRLMVVNDVLMINISDADIGGNNQFDVGEGGYFGDFYAQDKKLQKIAIAEREQLMRECGEKLRRFGITCATIDSEKQMEPEIIRMLSEHRRNA
ncbi:MAG: DUF58 domain-containing protein [Wujia sp.]